MEPKTTDKDSGSLSNNTQSSTKDNSQYLTFIMQGEEYGVDILCVQEIRGWEATTPLPSAPAYVKGVLNLRGLIVPVIDTRQLFSIPCVEYSSITVIIVLKVYSGPNSRVVGIVVDEISDVFTINNTDIKKAPEVGMDISTNYIHGFVEVSKKMVTLLAINQLLNLEDLPSSSEISEDQSNK